MKGVSATSLRLSEELVAESRRFEVFLQLSLELVEVDTRLADR